MLFSFIHLFICVYVYVCVYIYTYLFMYLLYNHYRTYHYLYWELSKICKAKAAKRKAGGGDLAQYIVYDMMYVIV